MEYKFAVTHALRSNCHVLTSTPQQNTSLFTHQHELRAQISISDCTAPLELYHLNYCTETSSAHTSRVIKTRHNSNDNLENTAVLPVVAVGHCFSSPENSLLSLTSPKSEGAAHVLPTASNKQARTLIQLPVRCAWSPGPPFNQSSFVAPLFSMPKCLPNSTTKPKFPSVP